jgi:hypothetical protein
MRMGMRSASEAYEKLEALAEQVKADPDGLGEIFRTGTPSEKTEVLLEHGFVLEDIHFLLVDLEALSTEGMELGGIWIW